MKLEPTVLRLCRSLLDSGSDHVRDVDHGLDVRVVEFPEESPDGADHARQSLAVGVGALRQGSAMHFTLRLIWIPLLFREEPPTSRRFFLISEVEG